MPADLSTDRSQRHHRRGGGSPLACPRTRATFLPSRGRHCLLKQAAFHATTAGNAAQKPGGTRAAPLMPGS